MAKFDLDFEITKGAHCEALDVHGSVELDEQSIEKILNLIRENGGNTDVEEIQLEEKYPDIYEKLDDACRDAASNECFWDWAKEGYEGGYFDEPVNFLEKMEESGKFVFDVEKARDYYGYDEDEEFDDDEQEDAKREQFYEWISDYYDGLSEEGKRDFLGTYYCEALDEYPGIDYGFNVEIPQGIIDMM